MKAMFDVTFPVVNPVTGKQTWCNALVGINDLDLPANQVRGLVQDVIHLTGQHGGIGTIIFLAEQLRIAVGGRHESGLRADMDAPPATIMWGARYWQDTLLGADVVVELNYDEGMLRAGGNEYTMNEIAYPSNGRRGNESAASFEAALDSVAERGLAV
jgi:hypothetical protein